MADSITARILGIPDLRAELARISKSTDRATMYTVRQGGRLFKAAARRNTPVYSGPRSDIPKGRLKKSIASSKRLTHPADGTWGVTVAPRGYPATAYARQQEARSPFMAPALDEVTPQLPAVAAKAWERATRARR